MKKLIALTVAMLPLTALADVTIYGNIEADVESGKSLMNADQGHGNQTRVDDTGSYIGFKGDEELGNGLKALWQVESYLSVDGSDINGNGSWATRDSFVGLQSQFGTVRVGKLSDYMNSDMETMDPWLYGQGVNGLGTMTRFDGRYNNAVRYDMPTLYGFDFSAIYSVGENEQPDGSHQGNGRNHGDAWGVGMGYQNSGFFGKLGYMQFQDQGANGQDGNYWRLEGGYHANNLLVSAAYQASKQYGSDATLGSSNIWGRSSNDLNGSVTGVGSFGNSDKIETREAALTVGYTFGAITPRVTYAWGDDAKVNGATQNNSGYNQYIVGVDYALSKRTTAYASYGYTKYGSNQYTNGSDDSEHTVAVGLQHRF
ncbi:MAG: porin [Microvirgula sp.]